MRRVDLKLHAAETKLKKKKNFDFYSRSTEECSSRVKMFLISDLEMFSENVCRMLRIQTLFASVWTQLKGSPQKIVWEVMEVRFHLKIVPYCLGTQKLVSIPAGMSVFSHSVP